MPVQRRSLRLQDLALGKFLLLTFTQEFIDLTWGWYVKLLPLKDHALASAGGCNIFTNFAWS